MIDPRFLLVATLAITPALAAAQTGPSSPPPTRSSEVVLFLAGDQRPQLRLAFPSFPAEPSAAAVQAAAAELETTLREDLQESGVFRIHGPADLQPLTLVNELEKDADTYRSLGDEVLLLGTVKAEAGKIVLEGRVFDLASRQIILGKRYSGEPAWARRIAHTFADEIVRQFTGQPGIALTQIAFSSDRSGSKEIYLMDADGHNQRPISAHRSISLSPSWSPKSDALGYVSFFGGPPGLYLADLASGRKRPIVTDGSFNASPAISPDGSRVAFARSVDGNIEVFLADVAGGNLRRLTNSPGIDTNPSWSADGGSLAFTSSRGGSPQIYVTDADGANTRRVTFKGDYNDGASFHPRSPQIVYSTRQGNAFNLSTVDLVTLESRLLTSGPGSKETPAYSPDGRKIAFAWGQGKEKQIWILDLASGGLRQITSEGRNNGDPAWSGYPK